MKMNQNSSGSVWLCGVRKSRHIPLCPYIPKYFYSELVYEFEMSAIKFQPTTPFSNQGELVRENTKPHPTLSFVI